MNKTKCTPWTAALFASLSLSATAADLIVEENGVLPNLGTIQAAVTAAQPGDRIFVKNKVGGIPYNENVVIDKPLTLLSFDANGQYLVSGTYVVTANGANFTADGDAVRIIGMLNQSGSISATSNNSTGFEIRLDVLGNQLNSGSINISGLGWLTTISGN